MRKIFLGLILILVFLEQKAFSKDIEVYCLSINSNTVFKAFVNENQFRQYSLNNTPNKSCEVDYASSSLYLQIPK